MSHSQGSVVCSIMKVCTIVLLLVAILGLAAANQYAYQYGDVSIGYIVRTITGSVPENQLVTTVDVTPPAGYVITGIKTTVDTAYNVAGPAVNYVPDSQDVTITYLAPPTQSSYVITVVGMLVT